MTRFAPFRAQLTSIMEALGRAAVAEVCGLLEDSYAAFQLQLRRSHEENRALRRELELLQDLLARGVRDGGPGTGERSCAFYLCTPRSGLTRDVSPRSQLFLRNPAARKYPQEKGTHVGADSAACRRRCELPVPVVHLF